MQNAAKRRGFLSLFVADRLVQGAAVALLGMFVPIFLYSFWGEDFTALGIFYTLLSLGYVVGIVPGMQITNKIGLRGALVLGGAFSALMYLCLYLLDSTTLWPLVILLGISIILFRIFHWVPYHVDFTKFTHEGGRGKMLGVTYATAACMGVAGPILAGYIITQSGYDTLFAIALVLLLIATVSYLFVPVVNERFTWSFPQTWKKLFAKNNRGFVGGMFASGAEGAITLVVWPIFLYELLDGNIFEIGALSTFVVGGTVLLQLSVGYYLDKQQRNSVKTLKIGSALYAAGWVFKIFVLSTVQVFFIGIYHNITKIFTQTPFDALLYDMSGDQGHYIDEFTVLREMAVHLGRAFALIVVVICALFVSIQWTFLIGAVASIALNMLYAASRE